MLLQFNFKNFRSFRDDATLDLTATKMTEYNNHIVTTANERILPVAAIFGANASGKSNVYEAFQFMSQYVISSFEFGGDSDEKRQNDKLIKVTPFLFDKNSKNAESSFEVFFTDDDEKSGRTYNYGFSLDQKGVVEEWLNYKAKTKRHGFTRIFYRSREERDFAGISPKSRENINIALQDETLVVSLGAKLKIAKLDFIRDWFMNTIFTNFGNPAENYFLSRLLPDNFTDSIDVQNNVVNYFASFDNSIIGFKTEQLNVNSGEKEKFRIYSVHKMLGSDETTMIPLEEESAGTLKMFSLYPMLQDILKSGGILFVDELNARLHPLLVRTILITFLDSSINVNKAQLIFTTHDAWQLSNNILRRDEIWFVDKDQNGVSNLYSLADFVDEDGLKIRKDADYEKNYLLGKYGAIPSLKHLNMLLEV